MVLVASHDTTHGTVEDLTTLLMALRSQQINNHLSNWVDVFVLNQLLVSDILANG